MFCMEQACTSKHFPADDKSFNCVSWQIGGGLEFVRRAGVDIWCLHNHKVIFPLMEKQTEGGVWFTQFYFLSSFPINSRRSLLGRRTPFEAMAISPGSSVGVVGKEQIKWTLGIKQHFGSSVYEVFGAGIFNHLNANSAAVSLCDYKSNIIAVMEVITFVYFFRSVPASSMQADHRPDAQMTRSAKNGPIDQRSANWLSRKWVWWDETLLNRTEVLLLHPNTKLTNEKAHESHWNAFAAERVARGNGRIRTRLLL